MWKAASITLCTTLCVAGAPPRIQSRAALKTAARGDGCLHTDIIPDVGMNCWTAREAAKVVYTTDTQCARPLRMRMCTDSSQHQSAGWLCIHVLASLNPSGARCSA